jgi:hypothetical protein
MTEQNNADKDKKPSDKDPSPTGGPKPPTQPSGPPNPPPNSKSSGDSSETKTCQYTHQSKEILVRVLEDDELKPFESETLRWARNGFILGIVTLALAVLTLIVFYCQLNLMQAQFESADSDSRTARRHTRQQIQILQEQAKTSQQQLSLQSPMVIFTGSVVATDKRVLPNGDHEFDISVEIKNAGSTTAMAVQGYQCRSMAETDIPSRCTDKNTADHFWTTPILAPNDPSYSIPTFQYAFSDENMKNIHDGTSKGKFYVFGLITYCDAFGDKWVSNVCARMNGNLKTFDSCSFSNVRPKPIGKCRH